MPPQTRLLFAFPLLEPGAHFGLDGLLAAPAGQMAGYLLVAPSRPKKRQKISPGYNEKAFLVFIRPYPRYPWLKPVFLLLANHRRDGYYLDCQGLNPY